MPTLNVKTTASRSVWKSPDGQREIFEVKLDHDGAELSAKTYSKDISTVDWAGTVESYEKEGRNGAETFVKQPPKEGGYSGSTRNGSQSSLMGSGSTTRAIGSKSFDSYTMYLSYAKDLAVACVGKEGFDDKTYTKLLEAVEAGGAQLYAGRPDAPKPDIDKLVENIDKIFDDEPEEEDAWGKK